MLLSLITNDFIKYITLEAKHQDCLQLQTPIIIRVGLDIQSGRVPDIEISQPDIWPNPTENIL